MFGGEGRAGAVPVHFVFHITGLAINNTPIGLTLQHLLLQEATVPGRGSLTAGHVGSSPGAPGALPPHRSGGGVPAGPPGGRHWGGHGGQDRDVGLLRVSRRRPR